MGDYEDPTTPRVPARIARPEVDALDAILGEAFPVLDDGFIRVVDYMGNRVPQRRDNVRIFCVRS